ncbi:MAG: M48 family metallopeptidase [Ignavibacteria bacterium]|nr:M48 family metallopeptidase [Ignavibacteria bacterium]
MNNYAVFILSTMLLAYLLDIVTTILNLRALRPELPKEFAGVYDADKYSKSQEYTRVRSRFGIVTGTFDLVVMLAFWFLGGFGFLDTLVRSWSLGAVASGLAYMGILISLSSLISMTFGIYSTFVIEERFGFNKTTVSTFIIDKIKGLALGVVIGVPVMSGILWFFETTGDAAWLYCWGAVTLFTLILQWIAPTWIMPIFNKFTPLEDGELRSALLGYAAKVDFPLTGIYVIDGSKRSSRSNAFFTGFGKNKRIALYDTLIQNHTIEELIAVLAHEVGHYKRKHIFQGMVLGFLQTGVMFYVLSLFLHNSELSAAFYVTTPSVHTSLIFFMMLYSPISTLIGIGMNIMSRKNEYEADNFAATTTGNPNAMIATLKKLSADNLSNLTPHALTVFLNYSHPTALQRIVELRK